MPGFFLPSHSKISLAEHPSIAFSDQIFVLHFSLPVLEVAEIRLFTHQNF